MSSRTTIKVKAATAIFFPIVVHLPTHQIKKNLNLVFRQLLQWSNEEQTRRKIARIELCELNFTSSAKLKNLLFWSSALTVSLLTSSRPICESTIQDQILMISSHVTLAANSQNAVTILMKTTPRNSSDPLLSAGQISPDAPHSHKMEQEIGRTPRKQPRKSINHYSQYKWGIQTDNKSVNRQHTRSLECIRRREGGSASRTEEKSVCRESSTSAWLH